MWGALERYLNIAINILKVRFSSMRKLGCLSVIEEQVFANKKLLSGLN